MDSEMNVPDYVNRYSDYLSGWRRRCEDFREELRRNAEPRYSASLQLYCAKTDKKR